MADVWKKSSQKIHGSVDMGGNPIALESYLRSQKKALFADDGSLGFEPADLQGWLQLWQDLRDSGACVPAEVQAAVTGFDNDPLTLGKAAFTMTATSRGLPAAQSLTEDTLALATFPGGEAGAAPGTNIIPAGWFAISPKAADKDGAIAMLKYLTSEPEAAETMGMARGVPIPKDIRASVAESSEGLDTAVLENYDIVEAADPAPLQTYPPGASALLESDLREINQKVGFGDLTVAKGATSFFATAEEALA